MPDYQTFYCISNSEENNELIVLIVLQKLEMPVTYIMKWIGSTVRTIGK